MTTVVASPGYPETPITGAPIQLPDAPTAWSSSTPERSGAPTARLVTSGGRVLAVTAVGASFEEAQRASVAQRGRVSISPTRSFAATSDGASSPDVPELPEVETIARELHARLAGRIVADTVVIRPDVLRRHRRPSISRHPARPDASSVSWRRAKSAIISLSGGWHLLVQPRFTGAVMVEGEGEPVIDARSRRSTQTALEPDDRRGVRRARSVCDGRLDARSRAILVPRRPPARHGDAGDAAGLADYDARIGAGTP